MNSTTRRRLALPALALAAGLTLAACGDSDTATTGSSNEHGGDHSADSGSARTEADGDGAEGDEADISFLTGMKPHHAQAVEMSDIVLTADPPPAVAALARQIKAAQTPEIDQMDMMLSALGEPTDGGTHAGHSTGHGGMMSDTDLAALRAATGTEVARLYLEAMIAHHQGAIEAADEQIADGKYERAVALAEQIKAAQQAEITTMQALLQEL